MTLREKMCSIEIVKGICLSATTVDSILSLIQQEVKECLPKEKKCSHIAHIEPCNDIKIINYNQALSDIKEKLKEKELI